MATREGWKLGANGCRGASWNDEHFEANSLTGTLRRGLLLSERLRTSSTRPVVSTIWYAEKYTRVLLWVVL